MKGDTSDKALEAVRQLLNEAHCEDEEMTELVAGVRLMRAFTKIKSPDDRRMVVELAERLCTSLISCH